MDHWQTRTTAIVNAQDVHCWHPCCPPSSSSSRSTSLRRQYRSKAGKSLRARPPVLRSSTMLFMAYVCPSLPRPYPTSLFSLSTSLRPASCNRCFKKRQWYISGAGRGGYPLASTKFSIFTLISHCPSSISSPTSWSSRSLAQGVCLSVDDQRLASKRCYLLVSLLADYPAV